MKVYIACSPVTFYKRALKLFDSLLFYCEEAQSGKGDQIGPEDTICSVLSPEDGGNFEISSDLQIYLGDPADV